MHPTIFRFRLLAATAIIGASLGAPAHAQQALEGDVGLACGALLCLAGGTNVPACAPYLARYFAISFRSLSDTLTGRRNFLKLCPTSHDPMLIEALIAGAGRCDADTLNRTQVVMSGGDIGNPTYVRAELPTYCKTYLSLPGLVGKAPIYVGTPETGGLWVSPENYDRALADYNANQPKPNADYWWR